MEEKHIDFVAVIGWIGSLFILMGYGLLVNEVIAGTSLEYFLINLIGSIGLAINLYYRGAKGPLFMQICFIGISLYGIWNFFGENFLRNALTFIS